MRQLSNKKEKGKGIKQEQPDFAFSMYLKSIVLFFRHGWLHYSTDETPIDNPPVKRKWMVDVHTENLSGTKECYVPYSTTRPKIESWQPPQ